MAGESARDVNQKSGKIDFDGNTNNGLLSLILKVTLYLILSILIFLCYIQRRRSRRSEYSVHNNIVRPLVKPSRLDHLAR